VEGLSDERKDIGELCDAIDETGSNTENSLNLICISLRKIYVDRITIINPVQIKAWTGPSGTKDFHEERTSVVVEKKEKVSLPWSS